MSPSVPGYFDAAAGLPPHPVAVQALQAALEDGWADPARLTGSGRRSALLLDAAREAAAAELGIRPDELSFLPSGAQALQAGVLGSLAGRHRAGRRLVHSAVEHSVVFKAADWHLARGGEVRVVGVDGDGRVSVAQFLAAAQQPGTATAVLQAANHEVGTRQPVAELAGYLSDSAIPLVVDASHELVYGDPPAGVPIFSADARLWGGPAGVGLLAIRRGTRWQPPFPVDESEAGRGLGVANVAAIVAAAASLRASRQDRRAQADRLHALVERLRHRVPELLGDAALLGDPADRLPHLLTFTVLYVEGAALLTELDRRGYAVSSGSSCTADTLTPSHVLVAMGALSSGSIRVSLHPGVDTADVERFLAVLPEAVATVRAQAPTTGPVPTPAGVGPDEPSGVVGLRLDSRGRRCPLPVLDLARSLPGIPVGGELTVLADDPAAASDIAAWCAMTGQLLLASTPDGAGATGYQVRRLH
ncbi:MAG: cysteine desulfurase/sulfurtransferase TusA family protein [Jatrophihabitans sp.]